MYEIHVYLNGRCDARNGRLCHTEQLQDIQHKKYITVFHVVHIQFPYVWRIRWRRNTIFVRFPVFATTR